MCCLALRGEASGPLPVRAFRPLRFGRPADPSPFPAACPGCPPSVRMRDFPFRAEGAVIRQPLANIGRAGPYPWCWRLDGGPAGGAATPPAGGHSSRPASSCRCRDGPAGTWPGSDGPGSGTGGCSGGQWLDRPATPTAAPFHAAPGFVDRRGRLACLCDRDSSFPQVLRCGRYGRGTGMAKGPVHRPALCSVSVLAAGVIRGCP